MSADDNRNTSHYEDSEQSLVPIQKCRYCDYDTTGDVRGMRRLQEHVLVKHGLRRGGGKAAQKVENGKGSLWDEEITLTRGELGTCLDALQMMDGEFTAMEQGTGYERPRWLRNLATKALGIAREKQHGLAGS